MGSILESNSDCLLKRSTKWQCWHGEISREIGKTVTRKNYRFKLSPKSTDIMRLPSVLLITIGSFFSTLSCREKKKKKDSSLITVEVFT
jgi:hypothetical protein